MRVLARERIDVGSYWQSLLLRNGWIDNGKPLSILSFVAEFSPFGIISQGLEVIRLPFPCKDVSLCLCWSVPFSRPISFMAIVKWNPLGWDPIVRQFCHHDSITSTRLPFQLSDCMSKIGQILSWPPLPPSCLLLLLQFQFHFDCFAVHCGRSAM